MKISEKAKMFAKRKTKKRVEEKGRGETSGCQITGGKAWSYRAKGAERKLTR